MGSPRWKTSASTYAKRTKRPEFEEDKRASLMELRGPFDGFVEKAVRAIIPCLSMADHNRYSVDARAAGRTVLVRAALPRIHGELLKLGIDVAQSTVSFKVANGGDTNSGERAWRRGWTGRYRLG